VHENEEAIIQLCEASVERLASTLRDANVGCLLRYGGVLRHVAHAGEHRLIYEIARDQGGVVWRAVDERAIQVVEDVRADPDYLAQEPRVHSEVAAPISGAAGVVAVLDVEFTERVFGDDEVVRIEAEARRLEGDLAPYVP
jgi:putative methionine-R-sulfoxide reductase with GAF domain